MRYFGEKCRRFRHRWLRVIPVSDTLSGGLITGESFCDYTQATGKTTSVHDASRKGSRPPSAPAGGVASGCKWQISQPGSTPPGYRKYPPPPHPFPRVFLSPRHTEHFQVQVTCIHHMQQCSPGCIRHFNYQHTHATRSRAPCVSNTSIHLPTRISINEKYFGGHVCHARLMFARCLNLAVPRPRRAVRDDGGGSGALRQELLQAQPRRGGGEPREGCEHTGQERFAAVCPEEDMGDGRRREVISQCGTGMTASYPPVTNR